MGQLESGSLPFIRFESCVLAKESCDLAIPCPPGLRPLFDSGGKGEKVGFDSRPGFLLWAYSVNGLSQHSHKVKIPGSSPGMPTIKRRSQVQILPDPLIILQLRRTWID